MARSCLRRKPASILRRKGRRPTDCKEAGFLNGDERALPQYLRARFQADCSRAAALSSRSQLAQKIDHRGVDLRRALLLGPVTATREHDLAAQSRYVVCQIGYDMIRTLECYHQVPIAGC
jgi:hypothetical protein